MGCEVASPGELALARAAGFAPERTVFDSPAKTRAEIAQALGTGMALNIDSFQELDRVDAWLAKNPGCRSVIGIRVNVEGVGPGAADMSLYEVAYADGGRTDDRVADPGAADWGADGDGSASIEPSDRGPGSMLHLVAEPEQWISINSPDVPVTPGTDYRFSVIAAVPAASADAGS